MSDMENVKLPPESLNLKCEPPQVVKYNRKLMRRIFGVIVLILVISLFLVVKNGNSTSEKVIEEENNNFSYIEPNYIKNGLSSIAKSNETDNSKESHAEIFKTFSQGNQNNLDSRMAITSNNNVAAMIESPHNQGVLSEYLEQQALIKIKEENNARLSRTSFVMEGVNFNNSSQSKPQEENNSNITQNQFINPNARVLKSGSIIPSVLITAINSDLPGMVLARVRENVFDTATGKYLLIPQGAMLVGEYSSDVDFGQKRAQIKFNHLHFPATQSNPAGHTVNLGHLQGTDLSGHTGLADKVNNHFDKVAVGVSISSLLAAMSRDPIDKEGYRQRALNKTSENISAIGQKVADKQLKQSPTITIRGGVPFNIMVSQDLALMPVEGQ